MIETTMPETLTTFSILPIAYERKLNQKYGITLESLTNGSHIGINRNLGQNVVFNGGYRHPESKIQERILQKYEGIPGFCAMIVDNMQELARHITRIHEINYSHYAWAKDTNLEGQFPHKCCGSSAKNILLNLMDAGYPNATQFYNSFRDHAYNGVPFVFGPEKEKGFIITDPTSDQLFKAQNAPRNNLFVVPGIVWKYITDWENRADLYPHQKDESTFANLHTLREKPGPKIEEMKITERYFRKVFANPIRINANDPFIQPTSENENLERCQNSLIFRFINHFRKN